MSVLKNSAVFRMWPVAAALALAACGGGGSDAGTTPASVDVSSANQEPVTRAVAATTLSSSVGGSLGGATASGGTPLASRSIARALSRGVGGRERPAAVITPFASDCIVSGSATITVDDRDNSQTASVGDVLTISFASCVDVAGESVDGVLTATLTQVSNAGLGARIATTALTAQGERARVELNGAFTFTLTQVSASVSTLRMVVDGSLGLALSTPSISDTITMLDGYTVFTTSDDAAVPLEGGTAGSESTTVNGSVSSSRAGGSVQVSTFAPFVQYTDDPYPRAGGFTATGRTGVLRATAQSTTDVLVEIDANGDGTYETSTVVPWTTLL